MMMLLWKTASSVVFALLLSVKFQETKAIRVCGTSLADTLAFACADRGGYHTPVRRAVAHAVSKRDVVYLMKTKPRSFYKPAAIGSSKTVPDDLERRSLHGSTWINLKGVVDECCRRSCTYETLISYCALTGASTTPPTAFNDFFNKVGYHSSEESSKASDEIVGSSEEVQSDQPANADGNDVETHQDGENQHRPQGGLSTGRHGQVQTLRRRPNIGMYSRNRPYFFVVSSHFNGHNEYPAFVN